MPAFELDKYNFHLPPDLIAAYPTSPRDASRLLVVERGSGRFHHARFADLPQFLRSGDRLALNDTAVLPCRLPVIAATGRCKEGLLVPLVDDEAWRHLLPAESDWSLWGLLVKGMRPGVTGRLGHFAFVAVGRLDDGVLLVAVRSPRPAVENLLSQLGRMPLPPYILEQREGEEWDEDRQRYQTVYADPARRASIAAPTAGLHFTAELLGRLREQGVGVVHLTLHVGRATFQPIAVNDIRRHRMGREWYQVPLALLTRAEGGRTVGVGTTVVRALESAKASGRMSGWTELFIRPGYAVTTVDGLITNFHLPKSSLLLLVMAFAGEEVIREAYAEAVKERYRFFSYGDAMLIL